MSSNSTKRYYQVDLDFWHKNTCARLLEEFGPWGPCVWLSLIAEAKRSSIPGQLTVTSMEALQDRLGFIDHDLPFTLEEFLVFTGRLKQTSRHHVDRRLNVVLTHYSTWQRDWVRAGERDKKNRWRSHQSEGDITVDNPVDRPVDTRGDRELDLDLELEDLRSRPKANSGDSPNGTTTPVAKATQRAETLIRNLGHELTAFSIDDELVRLAVPDHDRPALRALAETLRSAHAAQASLSNASEEAP